MNKLIKHLMLSLTGLVVMLGGMNPAHAVLLGPTPYLQAADSPFIPEVDFSAGYFFLEDFEDGLFNTPGVIASAGGVTSVVFGPGSHDSVDADDGTIDGSGLLGDSFFATPGSTGITFTFDDVVLGILPTHVGIVWTDGAGTTFFEAFDASSVSLGTIGPVAIAGLLFTGQTDEDRFFGVINPGGIKSIFISNSSGGIEVDHLQYGNPVPEPSTMLLLGSGLAGLVAWRMRKKGAA